MEVHRVVAVPPETVRLDEVREDESLVELLQQLLGLLDAVDVRLRRMRLVDVASREDVADLSDAVHRHARVADEAQIVRPARLERVVVTIRRALVASGRTGERPSDHASDGVLAREDLARDTARLVEIVERHRLFVRCDLEDGVGRRVDDPLARPLVLLSELLDDLRPRRRLVADHAAARAVHERVDHVVREAVRIRREGRRGDDAHELPVPRRRVLPLRALEQAARDRGGPGLRRAPCERFHVPEAERLEIGKIEAADCSRDVAERVRSLVAVLVGIGKSAGTDGVEHDHAGSGHAAILGTGCLPPSD